MVVHIFSLVGVSVGCTDGWIVGVFDGFSVGFNDGLAEGFVEGITGIDVQENEHKFYFNNKQNLFQKAKHSANLR